MPILARLETTRPEADRRAWPRHQICLGSSVGGEPVVIHDLSTTGMLIETVADLHAFDAIEIDLPEAGTTTALVVWHSGRYFGCEFKEPVFQAAVSAARLRSPPVVPVQMVQATLPIDDVEAYENGGQDGPDAYISIDEEKAPLTVRLRVILGSALVLWTLIIWATASLFKSMHAILD